MIEPQNERFRQEVYKLVAQIPRGKVMTYGQISALCGKPRSARIVGGIAHNGPSHLHINSDCPRAKHDVLLSFSAKHVVETCGARSSYYLYDSLRSSDSPSASSECEECGGEIIPWQRVVKKTGDLASGFPGGRENHKRMLESDGIKVAENCTVDVESLIWWPASVIKKASPETQPTQRIEPT